LLATLILVLALSMLRPTAAQCESNDDPNCDQAESAGQIAGGVIGGIILLCIIGCCIQACNNNNRTVVHVRPTVATAQVVVHQRPPSPPRRQNSENEEAMRAMQQQMLMMQQQMLQMHQNAQQGAGFPGRPTRGWLQMFLGFWPPTDGWMYGPSGHRSIDVSQKV
jgi:hypothetical protein